MKHLVKIKCDTFGESSNKIGKNYFLNLILILIIINEIRIPGIY